MMGQQKTPEPRRLYQQIADQIRQLILADQFPAGTRLPSERDLAIQLGVSRPSLREALIALEIDGSVEIRMGSGVYVLAAPERSENDSFSLGESPSELMHARAVIEGSVIVLASARIEKSTLSELRSLIDKMRIEVDRGRRPLDHDRSFHVAIAVSSGNSVLARLVAELFDERHSPISEKIRVRFENQVTWAAAIAEHEAILGALELRDPMLAQAKMQCHLEASRRRWVLDDE
jgi:DNA-binding FadR family transcriptional regulator